MFYAATVVSAPKKVWSRVNNVQKTSDWTKSQEIFIESTLMMTSPRLVNQVNACSNGEFVGTYRTCSPIPRGSTEQCSTFSELGVCCLGRELAVFFAVAEVH